MRLQLLLLFLLIFFISQAQESISGQIPVEKIEVHRPSCGLNNGYIKIVSNTSDLKYIWNASDSKGNTAFNLSEGVYECVIKNNLGDSTVVSVELSRNPTSCDALRLFELNDSHFVYQNLSNGIVSFRYNIGIHPQGKVHWSFGDNTPNSSQEVTMHQYESNGIFKVCLMNENQFGADTLCKELEINSVKIKGGKSVSHRSILNSDLDEWSNQIYFGAACNGKLFYGKNLSGGNHELWVKETEDSQAIKLNIGISLRGASAQYTIDHKYICHNNRFYFLSERSGQVYEYALYSTDGTNSGTLKHIDYDFGLRPDGFQVIDNQIYVSTNSQVYKLIGQNHLEPVNWLSSTSELNKYSSYYVNIGYMWREIVFQSKIDEKVVAVDKVNALIGELNGYFLFINETQNNGSKLWRTDGTQAGTQLVKDVKLLGTGYPEIFRYQIHNNRLYFTADDNVHGKELWVSDGTDSGTYMLKDINSGSEESHVSHFKSVGGSLYFTANDGVKGKELWKTDGTVNGTKIVKDIKAGEESSFVNSPDYGSDKIISFRDSLLYFSVRGENSLTMYDIFNDSITKGVVSVCEGNIGTQNSFLWGTDKLILLHEGLQTSCISDIPQVFDDIRFEGDNIIIEDSLHRSIKIAKGLDDGGYSVCQKPLIDKFTYTQSRFNNTHTFYAKDMKGCFSDKVSYTSYTYPGIEWNNFSIGSAVKCGSNQVQIRLNGALDSKLFSLNDLVVLVSINDGPYVELLTTYNNNFDLKATLPMHNETDNFKLKVKSLSRKVETESFWGLSENTIEVYAPKLIDKGHASNITVVNKNGIYPYNLIVNNQTISNIRDEVFQFPISPSQTQLYTISSNNSCGNVQVESSVNKVIVCESSITHMGMVLSNEYNSASNITSSGKLEGNVTYSAENSIVLNPGFNINSAVVFETKIKKCGQ